LTFVECVLGTFGNYCSSDCHCAIQTCDHINGTCPDGGCKPGYKGDTCSTGIRKLRYKSYIEDIYYLPFMYHDY